MYPSSTSSSDAPRRRAPRTVRARPDWLLVGLLALILCAEAGLRLAVAVDPTMPFAKSLRAFRDGYFPPIHVHDAELGYRYRAGFRSVLTRQDYVSVVTTNALGYRDREFRQGPVPGVLRVALVGDSYLAANQVPIDAIWARLLERHLQPVDGRRIEIMNFGVDGYSPVNIAAQIARDIVPLRPDVIVNWGLPWNVWKDQPRVWLNLRDVTPGGIIVISNSHARMAAAVERIASAERQQGTMLPQFLIRHLYVARLLTLATGRAPISEQGYRVERDPDVPGETLAQVYARMQHAAEAGGIPLGLVFRGARPPAAEDFTGRLGIPAAEEIGVLPHGYRDLHWPNDPHFSVEGNRRYAQIIAPVFQDLIARLVAGRRPPG